MFVCCACVSVVLSSDDEESCDISQHCNPAVQTLVTVEDAEMQGQPPQEDRQQEASDIEDMQVGGKCFCIIFDQYLLSKTHIWKNNVYVWQLSLLYLSCESKQGLLMY